MPLPCGSRRQSSAPRRRRLVRGRSENRRQRLRAIPRTGLDIADEVAAPRGAGSAIDRAGLAALLIAAALIAATRTRRPAVRIVATEPVVVIGVGAGAR